MRMLECTLASWDRELDFSAAEVFRAMLGTDCGETLCPIDPPEFDYEALVRFHGGVDGQCVLQCSPETARLLAEHMTAEPVPEGDVLALDALGELSNMVAGAWKHRIAQWTAQCSMSLPQVTTSPAERSFAAPSRNAAGIMCRRCYTFAGSPLEILLLAGG